MKKIAILIFLVILATLFVTPTAHANAGIPYQTFTYSSSTRSFIGTQDAYMPLSIQSLLGSELLASPTDITVDVNDNVYIADTGKVIKYSLEFDTTTVIGLGILDRPTGVHVDRFGALYVSDMGTKKAYKFVYNDITETYQVAVEYVKPVNTPYFDAEDPFEPSKIVTDRGGLVYVLLAGNINGLGKFANNGEFTGFFGGNQLPATFENFIRSVFFDEQQRRDWFRMIPPPVYNIGVDLDGLILTTTRGSSGYLKLNVGNVVFNQSQWGYSNIEDLFVGPFNTIFTINSEGYISEYAADGSVLFVFSGPDIHNQKGLFKSPTGIAVDSKNNIYVVDSQTSALQVFIPTDFANLVHEAINLYQEGQYAISLEPWQQVLKMNALFDVANQGIGDAHYSLGNYDEAMNAYMIARDRNGYSNAYWEVRNIALLASGPIIISLILVFMLMYALNRFVPIFRYMKIPFQKANQYLKRFTTYNEVLFGFYIMKKPGDGYYGIKREAKSSNLTAFIYLFTFFLVYLIWIYNTNFLFNDVIAAEVDLFEQMIFVFVPFTLWVLANYLVSSIRDGEGKLRDVFQASAYALLPMIITLPLLTCISQGLTNNEAFIYDTIFNLGLILTGVYIFAMVKEIHFYGTKQTLGNILITLFTAIMILVFVAIIYLLLSEVFGFFIDIYREVTSRG